MQRARRELEAAGSSFTNDDDVKAHIDWLREYFEEREVTR